MNERKTISINLSTVICMFIIMLLIFALAMVYMINNQTIQKLEIPKTSIINQTSSLEERVNTIQNTNEEKISGENTSLACIQSIENDVTSTVLNNKEKDTIVASKSYGEPLPYEGQAIIKDGYLYYSRSKDEELKKVDGTSNIKSLYIYNIGTGINKVPFVVTSDGTVYRLNSEEKLVKYEELSKYKVNKIIKHEGEISDTFTLSLIDGSTKLVEIQYEFE